MKENLVITISREFGSGGHEIGEKLAKALGVPFYDRQIIEKPQNIRAFRQNL